MTPDEFRRVRAVFELALDRPLAQRREYVSHACDGNTALIAEVEAMLAGDAKANGLPDAVPQPRTGSSAPEEGRFPVGTVLAGRYRLLGLIGSGGMGEVYRAYDLILNQTVALKFVSPGRIGEGALLRFRNEVRVARQVSHRNVCRVYDLGMVEGLHFLSMEYVDGEDLGSLLRRIGRLPQDKAIEFTRQICAGLAAAHERSVLHRDLKPANIMIDGRGEVRITDFGLAGLAAEIPLSDLRSGTPAYMSPEQKAGEEVTTRSDLYAIGLVLHEMFTGKSRQESTSDPSDIVKELDPAIERVILRCLEEDPKHRPSSALAVAIALPGADPVAAALAAGETPSPAVVAASEKEGFSSRTAIACFAAIVVAVTLGVVRMQFTSGVALTNVRIDIPPDALAYRARQILDRLGHAYSPVDSEYGFDAPPRAPRQSDRRPSPATRDNVADDRPLVIRFWYRQHRDALIGERPSGRVSFDSPPNIEPGMVRIGLDTLGRLIALDARPDATWTPREPSSSNASPDWTTLFDAAGLEPRRFTPVEPGIPPMAFDTQMAWRGTYTDDDPEPVRVDAAWWKGRPVHFVVQDAPAPRVSSRANPERLTAAVFLSALAVAVFVARRNLSVGRADRRGAAIIATSFAVSQAAEWLLTAHHTASGELLLLTAELSYIAFLSGALWIVYVASEPRVRRLWPDALISWARLQSGRFRDPLVASHILVGILIIELFGQFYLPAFASAVRPSQQLAPLGIELLNGHAHVAYIFSGVISGLQMGMLVLTVVVMLRTLVQRLWLADLIASVLLGFTRYGAFGADTWQLVAAVVVFGSGIYMFLWQLRRFGLLAYLASSVTFNYIVPVALGTWHTGRGLTVQLIPVVVALWAVWVIVSSRQRTSLVSA